MFKFLMVKIMKTLTLSIGPFSKQMDLSNFLDLKSSKIGKLCSKPGNEAKFASFTLHCTCMPLRISQKLTT